MAKAWTLQGWQGPLARPAGLPARRSGAGRTVGNGLRRQIERLTRSVRRVAGRHGPVARATLVCNRSLMFASVSGRPRHAGLETCATTIGRANPKIAGSRPCGSHARGRAWARLTRRHPPHARARALPEPNPGSEWPWPDSTANGEEPGKFEKCRDRQRVGKATSGKICPQRLQARRARSDAPYRAGRAAGPFDLIAHFGIRVQSAQAPGRSCGWPPGCDWSPTPSRSARLDASGREVPLQAGNRPEEFRRMSSGTRRTLTRFLAACPLFSSHGFDRKSPIAS